MADDRYLEIECEVCDVALDIKKAKAILSALINDMSFEKDELNKEDLYYIAYVHEDLACRAYAVIDYLNNGIEKLERIQRIPVEEKTSPGWGF